MRSLGNGYLKAGDKDFIMKPLTNFLRRSGFEKKLDRFLEVQARIFNARSLTRDVEFGTKRNVRIVFPLNDRRKLVCCCHRKSSSRSFPLPFHISYGKK